MRADQPQQMDFRDAEIESLQLKLAEAYATIERLQRIVWELKATATTGTIDDEVSK